MKTRYLLCAGIGGLALLGSPPSQAQRGGHNLSISTADHEAITDCGQVRIHFGDEEATVRREDRFTLSQNSVERLVVRPPEDGGVAVEGWDRDEYAIKACSAAGGGTESEARQRLSQVQVSALNGNVTADGPGRDDSWVVFFIVEAPRNAVLNVETKNGPSGFHRVTGKIEARATNGPISLRDCTGQARAHTENGPIEFSGNAGDFRLEAENGPVSVHLTGRAWQGAGLDARTENGPLTLRVPDGYASGVRVESAGYSPFECNAPACDHAQGSWREGHHSIAMGAGSALVTMHTVNGPVSIESARAGDRDDD